jgi:Asp-tRNA(Asn)/Glu-tRNA(Gln) amidotransferase A subunit family amidase
MKDNPMPVGITAIAMRYDDVALLKRAEIIAATLDHNLGME